MGRGHTGVPGAGASRAIQRHVEPASATRAAGPPRHLPITSLHSVICPPHNQSSQALSAAGWLNYRLWADAGDDSVYAVQRERAVKGREGPSHCPPSPDSRHPLFWRTKLPIPTIRWPLSPRAHSPWSKLSAANS